MKKSLLLLAAASLTLTAQAQTSIWLENYDELDYVQEWTETGRLKATVSGEGILSLGTPGLQPISIGGRILSDRFGEGDCWIFKQPVRKIAKGSYVEFDFCFLSNPESPKYYAVEILDGGAWHPSIEPQLSAEEDPALKYSFRAPCRGTGGAEEPKNVLQTFRLGKAVKDTLFLRIRAVGPYKGGSGAPMPQGRGPQTTSGTGFPADLNTTAYINVLGKDKTRDKHKVLCIGNSFTYYYGASFMLKEIAWNMGHQLHVVDATKGGQTFGQHLGLVVTNDAIDQGSYDFAFLQDQSQSNFRYGSEPERYAELRVNAGRIADRIREKSPACDIIHENTWRRKSEDPAVRVPLMKKGAAAMAEAEKSRISPIVDAFERAMTERPDLNLYHTDGHHPNAYGAYLKACVNYLTLGIDNREFVNRAPDCHLDPATARFLRTVAVQAVSQ